MSGLGIMLIAVVALLAGYFGYAKWLEKTWGINPDEPTPAVRINDGKDFSPASRWTVFAHQFTSITGAGPVTGPIIAAMFGWLPALLWMIVGGIFFGAVQDFTALYASVKNGGRSVGMIIEDYVGRTGRQLFLLFCWLFTLLVIAAFCDMVANTFNGFSKTGAELMPNAAAASISLLYMFVAVLFGIYLKYVRPSAGVQLAVGIVLMVVMLAVGISFWSPFLRRILQQLYDYVQYGELVGVVMPVQLVTGKGSAVFGQGNLAATAVQKGNDGAAALGKQGVGQQVGNVLQQHRGAGLHRGQGDIPVPLQGHKAQSLALEPVFFDAPVVVGGAGHHGGDVVPAAGQPGGQLFRKYAFAAAAWARYKDEFSHMPLPVSFPAAGPDSCRRCPPGRRWPYGP